jgi:DNA-binding NarL/FixJ family response regulator
VCWLLVEPASVPPALRARARTMAVVPLLAVEAQCVLDVASPWAQLSAEDGALAAALVRGQASKVIAHELGVTRRTVERRIGRLRERLGVDSNEALCARLSQLGF